MSNIKAKLASAFLLSVAANVGLICGASNTAHAADNCITEPKAETPQGKHWYYRIERGTARHCWYLRGEDEASARTPAAEPVASAKPAPATSGNAPARSLADARAEFAPKAPVADSSSNAPPSRSVFPDPPAVISAAPAPAAATTGIGPGASIPPAESQLTSRWPQASGTPAQANAAPQASLMVADAQPTDATAATPAPAEAPLASTPAREVGSLQKLALVALGALALAGLTGSLVYRLAGARWRRRREARWPERQASPSLADEARGAPWVAPELSPTVSHVDVAFEDAVHEDEAPEKIEFGKNDDSFEKIEDFLARLTRQLQDELQTAHTTELENPHPH